MRWKAEKPKAPQNGDTRTSLKFAWKKVRINEEWVWLESYWLHEHYCLQTNDTGLWLEDRKEICIWEYR